MNKKLMSALGLVIIFMSLNLFQNKAYSQGKYLMVLDIQKFPKKDKQMDNSVRDMIQNVNSLISHFNTENVIYIKAAGKALSISFKGFKVVPLPAPDFDSTLNIVNNNIFIKTEGDAFSSQELRNFLESRNANEIVLTGLMAEKCIYDTALGGKGRGYDITIITEGIIGMTPEKKAKAIKKMKAEGIKFMSITEIIRLP